MATNGDDTPPAAELANPGDPGQTVGYARRHPVHFATLVAAEATRAGAWATLVHIYGDLRARLYVIEATGDGDLARSLPALTR